MNEVEEVMLLTMLMLRLDVVLTDEVIDQGNESAVSTFNHVGHLE